MVEALAAAYHVDPPAELDDVHDQLRAYVQPKTSALAALAIATGLPPGAATRGELDDRWFKTASNSERVALQSLLRQRVLLTLPGQAEIIPAPEMIYGLDPDLREPPPLGALSPVGRPPEDHPGRADPAASVRRATEQLATPD